LIVCFWPIAEGQSFSKQDTQAAAIGKPSRSQALNQATRDIRRIFGKGFGNPTKKGLQKTCNPLI
jgi:hypothetical protein